MRITSFGLKSISRSVGRLASKKFTNQSSCLPHIPEDVFDELIKEIEILLGSKEPIDRYFWSDTDEGK